jgi:hypothetical protein
MANRKKDKKTNNDLQNTTQKSTARPTQTPLKTVVNSDSPEGWAGPASLVAPVVLI